MPNVKRGRSVPHARRVAGWLLGLCHVLLAGHSLAAYDLVVAQDGTGDYTTVQAAILAAPDYLTTRTTIFIKAGTYKEKIDVPPSKRRLTLLGEDRDTTILTYDDHAVVVADGSISGTADSPSVYIEARDFAARNLTFSNTAGEGSPAIAVWVKGNRVRFNNCAILGYQDTLCTTSTKAYFKKCYIAGSVDFIFGSSTAVFVRCTIECLDTGYITAASTDEGRSYGYVFKGCQITGPAPAGSVYLGRPWTAYAKVVFANCTMDEVVEPAGWDDWGDADNDGTAFYAEYNNTGAGADPANRAGWSHQLAADDAAAYTPANIYQLPTAPAGSRELTVAKPWYNDY